MSVEERAEYDTILHRKAVDKLHRITNGELLEIDVIELEELSMLIVRADPEDSNQYPFWVPEVGKNDNDRTVPFTTWYKCAGLHPLSVAKISLPTCDT